MNPATAMRIGLVAVALAARGLAQDCDFGCTDQWTADGCGQPCATCAALAPRWLARGSVVSMDRATEDSLVLMQSTTNQSQRLNADDFDFDWGTGFDVSLMRKAWDDCGFELRYLDLGQLDASTVTVIGGSELRLNSSPPVFLPNVQSIDARYTTDLISFEAHYRYVINDTLTYLLGFRYVGFDDEITANLDAAPQTFLYGARTRNDLYGAQVGAIGSWPNCCGCLLTSMFAKVGVFGNDMDHRSFVDTGVAILPANASPNRTSWIGEVGITSELPISAQLSILGGYGMVWLENVAIASDQMPVTDFFNGTGSNDGGSTIFHGANLGVVLEL